MFDSFYGLAPTLLNWVDTNLKGVTTIQAPYKLKL